MTYLHPDELNLPAVPPAQRQIAAAEAQVAELRAALKRYGTHRDACVAFPATAQDQIDERCSCGLSAIVANPLANSQPQTADLLLAVDAAIRRAPAEALARQTEDAPGCTSCGWNDEHSPQCPHYGRCPAPPSRDTERQQAVARVVDAARGMISAVGETGCLCLGEPVDVEDHDSAYCVAARELQDALASMDGDCPA